jgi:hypothetical protein
MQNYNECDAYYEHKSDFLSHCEDILWVVIQAVLGEEVGVGPNSKDLEEAE